MKRHIRTIHEDHIRTIHDGHKNHECESCGKSFFQASILKKHIYISHEGHKDYKCDSCGKSFSHQDHHQCDLCNKLVSQAEAFNTIMNGIKIVNTSELTLLGAPIFPEAINAVLEPKLSDLKTMTKKIT